MGKIETLMYKYKANHASERTAAMMREAFSCIDKGEDFPPELIARLPPGVHKTLIWLAEAVPRPCLIQE